MIIDCKDYQEIDNKTWLLEVMTTSCKLLKTTKDNTGINTINYYENNGIFYASVQNYKTITYYVIQFN